MANKKAKSNRRSDSVTLASANTPEIAHSYGTQEKLDQPVGTSAIFRRCRQFYNDSSFLAKFSPFRASFYNFGFEITTTDGTHEQQEMLEEWLSQPFISKVIYTDLQTTEKLYIEHNATVGEVIRNIGRDTWREFLDFDNCVGLWMDNGTMPTLLQLENCDYQDKLGSPIIRYTHGLGPLDYQLLGQDQVQRFLSRSFVLINPAFGEHFKVLKRAPVGAGFGVPKLCSLFRTLGEIESKERGTHSLAWHTRSSPRQHKLGYEIKQGPHAGKGTWHWNEKRDLFLRALLKGKTGPWDITTNFDHEIIFPWPDVKVFDDTVWKGTDHHLNIWGGALARFIITGKIDDGGFSGMRYEVANDRIMVRDFLKPLIAGAFNPPKELKWTITWSDLGFIDPSKFVEMWKLSVQQGFASVQTAREMQGLNHAKENARKMLEATDPNFKEKYLPNWDISHGISPTLGQTTAKPEAPAPAARSAAEPGDASPPPAPAAKPPKLEPDKPEVKDPPGLDGQFGGTGRTKPPYVVPPGETGPIGPGMSGLVIKAPVPPPIRPEDVQGILTPKPTGAPMVVPENDKVTPA